jgi:hypothetical protein
MKKNIAVEVTNYCEYINIVPENIIGNVVTSIEYPVFKIIDMEFRFGINEL